MVVVPDLPPGKRSTPSSITTSYDSSNVRDEQEETSAPAKSARSTGAGITVAMVSVALGFACCENLMYIFVYSPPSLGVGKILSCTVHHYNYMHSISQFVTLPIQKSQHSLLDLFSRSIHFALQFNRSECANETLRGIKSTALVE
jgi:hypothetical protein